MNKMVITYDLPIQISFFVYQYAKLRMFEFYYDFIDAYIPRPLSEYCDMDTDSAYLALAGRRVDDLVEPSEREHYYLHRGGWLPSSKREHYYLHRGEWLPSRALLST